MIITFKTISGNSFSMEFDPETTIGNVINSVCAAREEAPETAFLIYSGQKLADKTLPISAINYDQSKFIIYYNKNIKSVNQSPHKPVEQNPTENTQTEENKEEQGESNQDQAENKIQKETQPENSTLQEKPEEPEKTPEQIQEEAIQNIMDMGFDRQTASEALQRAHGSQRMALNLILNKGLTNTLFSQRRQEQEQQIRERRRMIYSLRTTPAPKHQHYTPVSELPGFSIAAERKFPQSIKEMHQNFFENGESTIESIDIAMANKGLPILDAIRNNRVPMITMLGFRAIINHGLTSIPFTEVLEDSIVNSLGITAEELPAIQRLAQTGMNILQILMIYRSTNGNERRTRQILESLRHF